LKNPDTAITVLSTQRVINQLLNNKSKSIIMSLPNVELGGNIANTQPALTFGQQLVGINFNPANDDKVGKAKKLCADLMDLVKEEYDANEPTTLNSILYTHTTGEILNAQMNVVKLLTLKY